MSIKQVFIFLFTILFINSCDLLNKDKDINLDQCDSSYGTAIISERSDLVAHGRLTEGTHSFVNKPSHEDGVEPYIAAATQDNSTSILIFGGDDDCIRPNGFCTLSSSKTRILVTDVRIENGSPVISQYVETSGTLHIIEVDPFQVRLDDVLMVVAPYPSNDASGSFKLNGTFCKNKN